MRESVQVWRTMKSTLARPLVRSDVEYVAGSLAGSGFRQVLSAQGRGTVGAKNAESR
jgi:hypothetical protein